MCTYSCTKVVYVQLYNVASTVELLATAVVYCVMCIIDEYTLYTAVINLLQLYVVLVGNVSTSTAESHIVD